MVLRLLFLARLIDLKTGLTQDGRQIDGRRIRRGDGFQLLSFGNRLRFRFTEILQLYARSSI